MAARPSDTAARLRDNSARPRDTAARQRDIDAWVRDNGARPRDVAARARDGPLGSGEGQCGACGVYPDNRWRPTHLDAPVLARVRYGRTGLELPMRGYVPTPDHVVDGMVRELFRHRHPRATDRVLDPGCGPGAFIQGIHRWCAQHGSARPRIVGVEMDPERASMARATFAGAPNVEIVEADFLAADDLGPFEYAIGNPPYVSILSLSEKEKAFYRATFSSAVGRFDLYMLFFEQVLRHLREGTGRVVFVTPEKFTYVASGSGLRGVLAKHHVEVIRLLPEDTFSGLATYPAVSVVSMGRPGRTQVTPRKRPPHVAELPAGQASWRYALNGEQDPTDANAAVLGDICERISCGVATGADAVFVRPGAELDLQLRPWARPTISGRQLRPGHATYEIDSWMLVPYNTEGNLIPLAELGALAKHLETHQARLERRVCTKKKPWYAFHDSVPMSDLIQPKILCKDICERPEFWLDAEGTIIPRHTVYYIVPKVPAQLEAIIAFLGSPAAQTWLMDHAQRAANGFLRVQSTVLKRLPIPRELARSEVMQPTHPSLPFSSRHARIAEAAL